MTTPPKIRIYRKKRSDTVLSVGGDAGKRAARLADEATAEVERQQAEAEGRETEQSEAEALDEKLAAIRGENLTGRQLRLARRIAAMHGIEVESDEEAVYRLRERNIDPFHRESVSLAVTRSAERAQALAQSGGPVALRAADQLPSGSKPLGQITPVKVPADAAGLASREALTEERRAAEIMRIQRDIARRRRIRLGWLIARLALLVGLPTLLAGWYYFTVATPLYETRSQFLIQQADSVAIATGGSILSGLQLNPDSVAVQSYLTSKNAMLRLDGDEGFKAAFQDPSLDPLLRLPPDATDDDAFETYETMVKVGYDPTEGVLEMKVVAPDPQLSQQYSEALLRYAEGMVDEMTARVRTDQVDGARKNYEDAENRVREAQRRVQDLQEKVGILDPASESGMVMGQVGQLETQLTEKELELAQLMQNSNPNSSRVEGVRGDIARLNEMISETRARLTQGSDTRDSLAQITGELRIAEADLVTRQSLLGSAAEQLELARIEANKQVRYLSLSIPPIAPQDPTYPKAVQNTIVAFMIFMGIYLMLSLTASILREQVSS